MSHPDPDWITFRGRRRQLHSFPLEPYLLTLSHTPDFRLDGRVRGRGYVATWEVREDDSLWLTDLDTQPEDGLDPGIALVFNSSGPIAADWVNQPLRVLDAADRRFSPQGNATVFARETYLSVRGGRLVMVEEMNGTSGRRDGGELTTYLEKLYGPDEAAFLRAAFANPDDAAPRLVYADWLDERNDRRGAIVRAAERLLRPNLEAPAGDRPAGLKAVPNASADWLWQRLLGYHRLATELSAIRS